MSGLSFSSLSKASAVSGCASRARPDYVCGGFEYRKDRAFGTQRERLVVSLEEFVESSVANDRQLQYLLLLLLQIQYPSLNEAVAIVQLKCRQ